MRYSSILFASLALAACTPQSSETTKTQTTSGSASAAMASATAMPTTTPTTATPTTTATATPVDVSPAMKAFMAMLDGKDDSAGKALKKYAVPAKQKDDLGMYKLTNPTVTASEKIGANTCYTMTSEAGVMKHTTKVCWTAADKIADITDKSE